VTYTLTIHNAGPSVASGVLVRDVLPAGLRYVRHTGGAYDPRTGVWDVGTLAVGSPRTLRIVATITRPGTVSNVAEIVASDALDADSTPNNGVPTEDDQGLAESSASLPTPPPTTVGPGAHATDPAGRLVPVVVLLAIVWLVVDAWRVRPGRRRVVRRRAVRR
jgi:hypothetical protein